MSEPVRWKGGQWGIAREQRRNGMEWVQWVQWVNASGPRRPKAHFEIAVKTAVNSCFFFQLCISYDPGRWQNAERTVYNYSLSLAHLKCVQMNQIVHMFYGTGCRARHPIQPTLYAASQTAHCLGSFSQNGTRETLWEITSRQYSGNVTHPRTLGRSRTRHEGSGATNRTGHIP